MPAYTKPVPNKFKPFPSKLSPPKFAARLFCGCLSASLFVFAQPASAISLVEAYQLALRHDPGFQGAIHDQKAGQESQALGLSNLLPNLSLSYNYGQNRGDTTSSQSPVSYDSKVLSLSFRQPLYSMDAIARYRQGHSQANYSDAKFSSSVQDLINRLVTAYLTSLQNEDQLQLAIAQRDALEENRLSNERSFSKGAGTKTDVLETQARYEMAQAQVVEAQDAVSNARDALAAMIGADPGLLDTLDIEYKALTLNPAQLSEWEKLALDANADIQAQRFLVEFSEQEVVRNQAGHMPRLDLVASMNRNQSESLLYKNVDTNINTIGIQLGVPLYSGGSVNAQTRQAVEKLGSARAELQSNIQKTQVEVRKQFNLVQSSLLRIHAMRKAEESALALVEATRKSVIGGQRVNLDVLNAYQQLFTTRRDLAAARYGYLLAFLKLKQAGGLLRLEDIESINTHFQKNR